MSISSKKNKYCLLSDISKNQITNFWSQCPFNSPIASLINDYKYALETPELILNKFKKEHEELCKHVYTIPFWLWVGYKAFLPELFLKSYSTKIKDWNILDRQAISIECLEFIILRSKDNKIKINNHRLLYDYQLIDYIIDTQKLTEDFIRKHIFNFHLDKNWWKTIVEKNPHLSEEFIKEMEKGKTERYLLHKGYVKSKDGKWQFN